RAEAAAGANSMQTAHVIDRAMPRLPDFDIAPRTLKGMSDALRFRLGCCARAPPPARARRNVPDLYSIRRLYQMSGPQSERSTTRTPISPSIFVAPRPSNGP